MNIELEQRVLARLAGGLYLFQMATGVFGQVAVRDRLVVADAAQTARNILASEQLFRLSIAGDLVTYAAVVILSWALYVALRPVGPRLAMLGLVLRVTENAMLCAATVGSLAALELLRSPDPALVKVALASQGQAMNAGFVLLGLGSAVFAALFWRSRYIPRLIAGWGLFASLLLSAGSLVVLVFPRAASMAYMMPMGLYEVGLGIWLLAKGLELHPMLAVDTAATARM